MARYLGVPISITFIFFSALNNFLLAQEIELRREIDTIPIVVDGQTVPNPFAGGFYVSRPTLADIDNDGDLDLFVGHSEGKISFFRNIGTANKFEFKFETDAFSGIDVISQDLQKWRQGDSRPVFADIDNDKDYDLFVGERSGTIHFYRNLGSSTISEFVLETGNFSFINFPFHRGFSFVDIDADGDLDLFVAKTGGTINFYRNKGTPSEPAFILESEAFASIDVVTNDFTDFTSLTFTDIDGDGDFDLFAAATMGIQLYRNIGTANAPEFVLETRDFASFGRRIAGSIVFGDLDDDGDDDLVVGATSGQISLYRNVGTNIEERFNLETQNLVTIDIGTDSYPSFVDIDNDGDEDLFVGEALGRIRFFRNIGTTASPAFKLESENFASIYAEHACNPTFADIDDDGDFDLFVGQSGDKIKFYRNSGSKSEPSFLLAAKALVPPTKPIHNVAAPTFADIDRDGDLDLFVGQTHGNINFFRNNGDQVNPSYTLESKNFSSIKAGLFSAPTLIDIDNDGDLDLIVRGSINQMHLYENIGTSNAPSFTLKTKEFADIQVSKSVPAFVDIDNDKDLDLFIGEKFGGIHFYRNLSK